MHTRTPTPVRDQWRLAYRACRQDTGSRSIYSLDGFTIGYVNCRGGRPPSLMASLRAERAEALNTARLWVRGVVQEWMWNRQPMPCDRREARHWLAVARRHNRSRLCRPIP